MRASILMMALAVSVPNAGAAAKQAETKSPYLRGLTAAEANAIVKKLRDLQAKLRGGEELYVDLLSGAPASYDATLVPPREAFLHFAFEQPISVERSETVNPVWQSYRVTYLSNGQGKLFWDIEVLLGANGEIARVEMFNRAPHPY